MTTSGPVLSVVVTIVDGGPMLASFLEAMSDQEDPPALEVIVPFDATVPDLEPLQTRHPEIRFLDLGRIATERPVSSAAGQHELYDRRRSAGLAAATGDLIAILEDRGAPAPDWARTVVELHDRLPHSVIGGAIEPVGTDRYYWPFYVCDFGRYGRPIPAGPASWVSDVNVSYKRSAIEATRHLWRERFREPIVHWALMEQGEVLYLSPELVVHHRRPADRLAELIPERFHWGRLFGHIRSTRMSLGRRLAFALLGPAIPVRLFARHARAQARRGRLWRYVRRAPVIALLLTAWTTGEVWGYLTQKP